MIYVLIIAYYGAVVKKYKILDVKGLKLNLRISGSDLEKILISGIESVCKPRRYVFYDCPKNYCIKAFSEINGKISPLPYPIHLCPSG